MEILIFILLVSLFCPGSSRGGAFEFMMIPVVIMSVALIIGFFSAIAYAAAFAGLATGNAGLGVVTGLGLFFGTLFLNRHLANRSDRRRIALSFVAQSCGEPASTSPDCALTESQG